MLERGFRWQNLYSILSWAVVLIFIAQRTWRTERQQRAGIPPFKGVIFISMCKTCIIYLKDVKPISSLARENLQKGAQLWPNYLLCQTRNYEWNLRAERNGKKTYHEVNLFLDLRKCRDKVRISRSQALNRALQKMTAGKARNVKQKKKENVHLMCSKDITGLKIICMSCKSQTNTLSQLSIVMILAMK